MSLKYYVLSLVFLALGYASIKDAEAIAIYDCNVHAPSGPQPETWYWHQLCWLEVEFHEDIPEIELVKVRNLTVADVWQGYPDWHDGPYEDYGVSSTEGLLYRTGTAPNIFMSTNGEIRAYTWAIKYETMNSFDYPILYAPIEVHGVYFYRIAGVWDVHLPFSNSDHENRCPTSCGYGTYWFNEPWHP
jgi:hypothetical protein